MASRKISVHRVPEPYEPPTPAANGMDNPALDNHDTVRSMAELISNESALAEEDMIRPTFSQSTPVPVQTNGITLRQLESGVDEQEEEVDIEEEARRMGVDAGEIAMISSQTSIRRLSSQVSRTSTIKQKDKEYPLKIAVASLFVTMVLGVSLIFHFYNTQLHLLEIGAVIKFNELTRHIDFEGENDALLMRGDLGLEIPSEIRYLDCSTDNTRTSHLCLTWKKHAQVWIDYIDRGNVNCFKIAWWGENYDTVLKDCYDIGDGHWFGGGFLTKDQMWAIDNISLSETLFVTGNLNSPGQLGPVLERYWLHSNGIAIYAPSDFPLYISFNKVDTETNETSGKFCLMSYNRDKVWAQQFKKKPEMNYTVCVSDDINSVHAQSLNETLFNQERGVRNVPSDELFKNTVWSTESLDNITEESLRHFRSEITDNNYSHGYLILSAKWEQYLGDLTFNTHKFVDASAMLKDLSAYFNISLSITPYIDTRSVSFQHDIHEKLLVEDAGGIVPGLTQYSESTQDERSIIAGVIKVDSKYFQAKLEDIQETYAIESVMLKGGDVGTLPYGADHGAVLKPNMNYYTQRYLDVVNGTYTTLFAESASQAQLSMPIIVMPALPSTWAGLQAVLPKMFTLGLLGYPFVLPEVIGGSVSLNASMPEKELYIRWLGLSAFLPIMRFSTPPHSYDSQTIDISRKLIEMHSNTIAPLVMKLAEQSVVDLQPIVRPMWMIAPNDQKTFTMDDQFLIGDNLLVAPVLTESMKRDIYLPEGSWLDMRRNVLHTGPLWLKEYPVTLDEVPYFKWQSQ